MFFSLLFLIVSYFLGSIPFGLLVSNMFSLDDPRTRDSQNIGATNVLRSGHKLAAFLTLTCDALKGILSVSLALYFAPSLAPMMGMLSVLGHVFPCWLDFKGGKGIATAFGALLVLNPLIALLSLGTWALFLTLTHFVSLASLMSVLLSPLYALGLGDRASLGFGLISAFLLLWTHRKNLSRLYHGTEQKLELHTFKPSKQSK